MLQIQQMRCQKRVDVLGVSEPSIQVESDNRIRVQLAGVEDQAGSTRTTFYTGKLDV